MNNWKAWITQANISIKEGRGESITDELTEFKPSQVPVELYLDLAFIARRVGAYYWGVQLLHKHVTQEESLDQKVYLEYGCCLAGIGNYEDASFWLQKVTEIGVDIHTALIISDAYFRTWRYQEGLEVLERAIPSEEDNDYYIKVLELNIIAANIALNQFNRVLPRIDEFLTSTQGEKYQILYGNGLELKGQTLIKLQRYSESIAPLRKSAGLLEKTSNLSRIFPKKWLAIALLAENKNSSESKSLRTETRKLARSHRHWETLRDLDLYQGVFTNDQSLVKKVYYGTPHTDYRQRIRDIWPLHTEFNGQVLLGNKPDGEPPLLELESGVRFKGKLIFKNGTLNSKVISILLSDIYAPISRFKFFKELFPSEFYNPFTSDDKVYKAIIRTRKKLLSVTQELELYNTKSYGYRIRPKNNLIVRYPIDFEQKQATPLDDFLIQLKNRFENDAFSRSEAARVLEMPDRSVSRMIKEAIDHNLIQRFGSSSATRYKLL